MWVPQASPWEIVLRAVVVYVGLLVALRLLGRKELARSTKFDAVLLLLLAQALRMTLVGDDPSLTAAALSLGTLLGVDWLFSWTSWRFAGFRHFVDGTTRVLVSHGRPNSAALRQSRMSREELLAHLRAHGLAALEEVEESRIEPNGRVTVIPKEAVRGS